MELKYFLLFGLVIGILSCGVSQNTKVKHGKTLTAQGTHLTIGVKNLQPCFRI